MRVAVSCYKKDLWNMSFAHLKGRRVTKEPVYKRLPQYPAITVGRENMETVCLLYLHPLISEVLRFFAFPLFKELRPHCRAGNTKVWWLPLDAERRSILGRVETEFDTNRNMIIRIGSRTMEDSFDTHEYETFFFVKFPYLREGWIKPQAEEITIYNEAGWNSFRKYTYEPVYLDH